MAGTIVLGITIRADGSAQVSGELNRVRAGLDGAGNSAQNANRSFAAMAREALGLGSALKGLAAGLSAVALYQSTKDIIMLADKMTLLDSRIKIATKSVSDYKAANDALTKISLATGSSLDSNVVMFGRLNKSVESAGGSYRTTLGLVKTLNEGLKISGASAGESSSVMIQLSQALSSGALRGDEFNSVMENGSRIVDALTTATGKTKGELRKMAEQGQLTSELVISALQAQANAIHDDFSKIPLTIGAALENITTSFSRYIQSINEASGSTGSLAQILNSLSTHLVPIIDGIVTLGKVAVTVFAGQMAISIGTYATAKYAAITMEYAHAAALTMDIERTVALTAAQLAATSATVASIQATLASTTAMGARMAITNQLNIALLAQAEAQLAATAAMTAQTAANTAAGLSFAALLNPINLVNIGLAGLVGWEIGGFLNKFESVRRVANDVLYSIVTAIESVSYYWDRLTAVMSGNTDKLDGLKAAHLAQNKVIDDLISSENAYVLGSNASAKAADHQTTAIAGLTAVQATATDTTKKAADDAKKKSEAIAKGIADEIAALNDQHQKLLLSERDYYASTLAAKGMSFAQSAMALAMWDSNKALEARNKGIDAGKSAMDAEVDRYNQLTLSARAYFIEKQKLQNVPADQIATNVKQFDVNAGIADRNTEIDAARSALEQYNTTLDQSNQKMGDLSDISSSVFDGASGGIDKMTGAFTNMLKAFEENQQASKDLHNEKMAYARFEAQVNSRTQAEIKKNNGQHLVDLNTIAKFKNTVGMKERRLELDTLKDSLSGIRQTSSAIGQMFEENSKARKAFSIISLAASVAERIVDIQKLTITAAIAVAEQGKGDPYTAFARIAAMAAIVGSILAAAGAGTFNFSGAAAPPKPTASPDSDTVLGDVAAKSESINKTYELLKDIHAEEYVELKGINQGVASLVNGITNTITRLFQAGGINDFATLQPPKMTGIAAFTIGGGFSKDAAMWLFNNDPIRKWLVGGLFGGKQTQKVIGQGIQTSPASIADILAGKNFPAQQYAEIETKTKGGWFSKDKYRTSMQYAALDEATQEAMSDIFKSMSDTMVSVAEQLGHDTKGKIEGYIIPALTIDLKGLSGEDAAKKLNNIISTALDTMADTVFGDIIGQYQQLGEGMLETAIRIVAEVAIVKDALATDGITLAGNAIAISNAIVQAAGGLKEFQKQFESFYDKFFTDAEKQERLSDKLSSQFGEMFTPEIVATLGRSREEYRKLIAALDQSNPKYAEQYALLMKLSESADRYYSYLEEAADKAQQLASQQRSLDIQLMDLSGNSIGALVAKRIDEIAAMDESLRATQRIIYALQDFDSVVKITTKASAVAMQVFQKSVGAERKAITDQYNAGIKTTQTAIDLLSNSADKLKGLSSALKGFLDNLVIKGQESIARAHAQSQLSTALIIARAGGGIANPEELIKAVDAVAKPSEELFGNFVDYQRDFMLTANTIGELSLLTDTLLTVDEKQLNALRDALTNDKRWYDAEMTRLDDILSGAQSQLDAVNGVTVAVMTVESAIANLAAAISAQGSAQTAQRSVQGAVQSKASGGGGLATASSVAKNYQDILGREADPAGLIYWASSGMSAADVAIGIATSAEAQVNNLYSSLLGRAADPAGAAYWTAALNSGASLSDITAGFTGSQEYKALHGFAVGINDVPYDMTANIHKGERILPAADNRELMMRLSEPRRDDGRSNAELIAEVRALREELRAGQAVIASNTGKTARILRDVTQDGDAITTTAAV